MPLRFKLTAIVLIGGLGLISQSAAAAPITGGFAVDTPFGHYMELKIDIDDTTTTFELTGPDFSWYAFGFDTTSMAGYSLIVEGAGGSRTAVEQNLVSAGAPGLPQTTQNITLVDTIHDEANNLTTIILERPNVTGDPNDAVFSTNLSELDIIWAYDGAATPVFPSPTLSYHGFSGRGFGTVVFSPVPEPSTLWLAATSLLVLGWRGRRKHCRVDAT